MAIIKYENYITGQDEQWRVESSRYVAQLFTPSITHRIRKVKLYIIKTGSPPGNLTVEIQGVSAGHPDGSAVASGTIVAGDVPGSYTWYEITLGEGAILTASTQYALRVDVRDGDSDNYIYWYEDSTSPTYAGGNVEGSTDSGSGWTTYTDKDFMFEEWGNANTSLEVFPADAITRVTNLIHRYNRAEKVYTLEMALGDVVSDFGIPDWASRPISAVHKPEEIVEETVQEAIDRATPPEIIGPKVPGEVAPTPAITIPLVELPQVVKEALETAKLATAEAQRAALMEALSKFMKKPPEAPHFPRYF